MKINGIEIKPGMILTTSTEVTYIVFPSKYGLAGVNYHEWHTGYNCWYSLQQIVANNDIVIIRDAPKNQIYDGKILWERDSVKEFTIKEIADLLNIPVEQLRIRDVTGKYECDFKKEFFKPGMIVEVYNRVSKTYCMVVPTICSGLCISGENDWEPLFDFDNNLMKGSLEITKVYGICKINKGSHKICIDNRDLLWSKPVEYTLADIAYRLDIPVEKLKIKN